jgi:hypothetical protein
MANGPTRRRELIAGVWQEATLSILRARFGEVPIDVCWLLEDIKNKKSLQKLRSFAFQCLGWEDFRSGLREWGSPDANPRSRRNGRGSQV